MKICIICWQFISRGGCKILELMDPVESSQNSFEGAQNDANFYVIDFVQERKRG